MLLTDYIWSRNPRGMHNQGVFDYRNNIDMYRSTKMGWLKLVVSETEYIRDLPDIFDANITPIVRMYLPRWGNAPMSRGIADIYLTYARAGVRWFEFYNEPNLGVEWPNNYEPDWRDSAMMSQLMTNWLQWAEFIIQIGGYPGFIALAESDDPRSSSVRWMDAMLNFLANTHYERFLNVLRGGCYCATHPYILNHWYQEQPGGGPLSARDPGAVNAGEGGWHFQYPYDDITQNHDPGRTVYGGTRLTPNGDPNGLIAMGLMFNQRCQTLFGTQAIPVIGTEGGIWDWPAPGAGTMQPDNRFPPYSNDSHAEGTVAMFDWIATQAPPWMFGVTLWKEDIYEEKGGRALARMAETPAPFKNVPALNVMFDGSLPSYPSFDPENLRGPGPIHGQVDFHIVIIDNDLSTDWFFETALSYWDMFRPAVTSIVDFFEMMPYTKSLAVTLIIGEEQRFDVERQIRTLYPNTYIDTVEITEDSTFSQINRVFEARVDRGLRFG